MSKLAWKLKNQMVKEEEENDEVVSRKIYKCPYCQKEFTNGKAYGGHKKSHFLLKNKGVSKNHDEKIFISEKPLNGDMKNHQERACKDMESLSFSIGIDSIYERKKGFVLDLSNTLPVWCKTGKRSGMRLRASIFKQKKSLSFDAATNLLALANANPAEESLPPKKRKSIVPKNSNHQSHGVSGKALAFKDSGFATATDKHVCSICNRCFKSYQAMGGHKAHHRTTIGDEDGDDNQRYKCTFCDKSFGNGQALGGHKRHCKTIVELSEESHGGILEKNKKKKTLFKALSFDLNKLSFCKNEGYGEARNFESAMA